MLLFPNNILLVLANKPILFKPIIQLAPLSSVKKTTK